jgi:hypothetical protein
MKLKVFFLIVAIIFQLAAGAQSKFRFGNSTQIGLLSGNSKSAVQLQTINGISYKTFFAGAGIGIDNYYFKTIPLFAGVRKNIFEKNQTPFVYVDAGTNFPAKKSESTTWKSTSYQPGLYYDIGIGYKWLVVKRFYINASFGFSQKKYGSREEYQNTPVDSGVSPDRYSYRLQRYIMKFGLSF